MKFRTGFKTSSDEVKGDFLKGKYFNIHFEKKINQEFERNAYEIIIEADSDQNLGKDWHCVAVGNDQEPFDWTIVLGATK